MSAAHFRVCSMDTAACGCSCRCGIWHVLATTDLCCALVCVWRCLVMMLGMEGMDAEENKESHKSVLSQVTEAKSMPPPSWLLVHGLTSNEQRERERGGCMGSQDRQSYFMRPWHRTQDVQPTQTRTHAEETGKEAGWLLLFL